MCFLKPSNLFQAWLYAKYQLSLVGSVYMFIGLFWQNWNITLRMEQTLNLIIKFS